MGALGTRVCIVETGQEFPSIRECARALGTYSQRVAYSLNKENATAPGGYHVRTVGKRAMADIPKRLYIRLREGTDEPMAVADTEKELAEMLGLSVSAVSKGILRNSPLYATVMLDD